MLADLLEREVKKEGVNGAATLVDKELRISDNGLELIPKDARGRFAVDMGVVGMNDLTGVDLGDGSAAPKAAHLIAQVDDSGHVQIHLEEDAEGAMCNGQSLLDQLEEACQVSSSTDSAPPAALGKAVKRPAEPSSESESPAPKKALTNQNHIDAKTAGVTVKTEPTNPAAEQAGAGDNQTTPMQTGPETSVVEKVVVNGVGTNGVLVDAVTSQPSTLMTTTAATQQQVPPPIILGPNAPRTFLILQPQLQQQATAVGLQHAQGQRVLLAIQRPGGVVQHVTMPANVVAISSGQLQANGSVVTLTTTGGITTVVSGGHILPVSTAGALTAPITTVASSSSNVVTTASVEGLVTFSGGAVAFPARPTENATRPANPGESHVTITPVSASSAVVPTSATMMTTTTGVAGPAGATVTAVATTAAAAAAAATKKRTNSVDVPKPRGRPLKSKSIDGMSPGTPSTAAAPASPSSSTTVSVAASGSATVPAVPSAPVSAPPPPPSPLPPFNPTHQFLCEWKDCMKAFKTPHEVYVHACHAHCPAHIDELGCLWERCDGLKRKRFSMMTHLMDRHCNDEVFK